MPAPDSVFEYLAARVRDEKRLMTSRTLALERRLHIAEARRELQGFYTRASEVEYDDNEEGGVHATFVIKGTLAPLPAPSAVPNGTHNAKKRKHGAEGAQEDETMDVDEKPDAAGGSQSQSQSQAASQGADASSFDESQTQASVVSVTLLVSDAKLEEAKKRFSRITSLHIYSVQYGRVGNASAGAALVASATAAREDARCMQAWEEAERGSKLGAIRNDEIEDLLDPKVKERLLKASGGSAGAATSKAPAIAGSAAAVAAAKANPDKPASLKKDSAAPAAPEKMKGTLDFSASKGAAKAKEAAAKEAVKAKAKEEKKPKAPRKGNAALVSSDEDEDEDSDAARAAAADEADDEEFGDGADFGPIGYDDEEMDDVAGAGAGGRKRADAAKAPSTTSSSKAGATAGTKGKAKTAAEREKERKALAAMMDSDAEGGAGDSDPDVAAKDKASTSMMQGSTAKERRRVRKQRTVKKKEKTKDAKGRTVVRDVEAYESYSSWESSADEGKNAKAKGKAKAPPAKGSKPASTSTSRRSSSAEAPAAKGKGKSDAIDVDGNDDSDDAPPKKKAPAPKREEEKPKKKPTPPPPAPARAQSGGASKPPASKPPASKPPAKSGSAGSAGGAAGGQKSLMSFFGKPKSKK